MHTPLYFWNNKDYFQKLPHIKIITSFGKRRWDPGIEHGSAANVKKANSKTVFTMPSFARHGRWGNIVFQYIFIRILALNNDGDIELNRAGESLNNRMVLYEDMLNIPDVQSNSDTVLLDSYQIFPPSLSYIPYHFWRALFVSNVRLQKCFILKNVDEAIKKPLPFTDQTSIEVEGLFMVNPKFYKQHKAFIQNELFQPNVNFKSLIQHCVQNFGNSKTIIGIHIRRGDYVQKPLKQFSQFPIPVKYIIEWLVSNLPLITNPVIYVCSDDSNAYKEIEMAGFEVFCTKKLLPENENEFKYEQLDWEILRQCDILLTSNSSFSFTSAFLSTKNPKCYLFHLSKKKFISFDPWETEPLQSCSYSPYLWSYLYSRFTLVRNMVNFRSACSRLAKDIRDWVLWKATKILCLYYIYGVSISFFLKLLNLLELFRVSNKRTNYLEHTQLNRI